MQKQRKSDIVEIKICIACFNCKKKDDKIYCKLGVWSEKANSKSILHTPFDFNCNRWEEA